MTLNIITIIKLDKIISVNKKQTLPMKQCKNSKQSRRFYYLFTEKLIVLNFPAFQTTKHQLKLIYEIRMI